MHTIVIALISVIFLSIPIDTMGKDISTTNNESVVQYFSKTLPKNLLLGTKNSFTIWNLVILGASTGTSVVLSQTEADREIQESLKGSLGDFANIGDIGGSALALTGITIATYATAECIKDDKLLQTSEALIEAEIITAVMTSAVKLSVGRQRPDESGSRFTSSFPSGHVSGSFTLASVFDSMYGHKVGIPLYTFASFIGLTRISDNKHYLSDVLFGAALGTVIGRSVANLHKNEDATRVTVMPFSDGTSAGLAIALRW